MGWFRRKATRDERLLGRWRIDPIDAASIAALGEVAIEFDDAGNRICVVKSDERDQVILMTCRVDGDAIVTDQPSHPRPERSGYAISDDGILTLSCGGVASHFVRVVPT